MVVMMVVMIVMMVMMMVMMVILTRQAKVHVTYISDVVYHTIIPFNINNIIIINLYLALVCVALCNLCQLWIPIHLLIIFYSGKFTPPDDDDIDDNVDIYGDPKDNTSGH